MSLKKLNNIKKRKRRENFFNNIGEKNKNPKWKIFIYFSYSEKKKKRYTQNILNIPSECYIPNDYH